MPGCPHPCSVPVVPLWVAVPRCGVGEQDRPIVLLGAEESRKAKAVCVGHLTLPSLLTCPFLLFLQVLLVWRG